MRITFGLILLLAGGVARGAQVDLLDGDRVVFIGSALFERDVRHNYLETLLTIRHPECNVTFRNVGWTGDKLPASDRLVDYVKELKPTVLFIAFGMHESLEAQASVERFVENYNKLLDGLKPTRARLVLISPIVHEKNGEKGEDPAEHNQQLKTYSDAILKIANERRAFYINLFTRIERFKEKLGAPLTDDGIHLNAAGYWLTARMIEQELGFVDADWGVELDASGRGEVKNSLGVKVGDAKVFGGGIEFTATNKFLPPPSVPDPMELIRAPKQGQISLDRLTALSAISPNKKILIISGLKDAVKYSLKVDGRALTTPQTGAEWANGQVLVRAADWNQAAELRKAITEKNQMFFDAHNPGKTDKGQFARDMAQIEEYITRREIEIARLRVPVVHRYVVEQVN